MSKKSLSEKIRVAMRKNPNARPQVIARDLNVRPALVYAVRAKMRKDLLSSVEKPNTITVTPTQNRVHPLTGKILMSGSGPSTQIEMFDPAPDAVNHPAHYKTGGIETIDFIEAKKLNYNLGNVVKYVTRADHKGNRKQDLEKALWYLKRELGAV